MYNYETLKILLNSRDFSYVRFTSGALYKFKKGKVTFGNEHLYVTYDNIIYQKELKNVHKVVEKITVNKKGEVIDDSICG